MLNSVSTETGALLALLCRSSFIDLSTEYMVHSGTINKSEWGQGKTHVGSTHLNAVGKQRHQVSLNIIKPNIDYKLLLTLNFSVESVERD